MKNKKTAICVLIAMCCLLAAGIFFYRWQNPTALLIKKTVKYQYLLMMPDVHERETSGLDKGFKMQLYIDGHEDYDQHFNSNSDCKRVYRDGKTTRLVNYLNGYQMDFPEETEFDFSMAALRVVAKGEGYSIQLSIERSPYEAPTDEMTDGLNQLVPDFPYEDGTDQYIGYYESRFLLNDDWQQKNDVQVSDVQIVDCNGYKTYIWSADISRLQDDMFDGYTYAYVKCGGQYYLRIVMKYQKEDTVIKETLTECLNSVCFFDCFGTATMDTACECIVPETWSEETALLYNRLAEAEQLTWGIYTDDMYQSGIEEKIPSLENSLQYKFGVVLSYVHYTSDFPTYFLEQNWNNGRIVELTYQLTDNNNEDMYAESLLLNLYRGENDDRIREFAQAAKEFEHPFLFRLCNEMNSDWTSYSGVVNMADPDMFIAVWERIYTIFEEEGVDNCIWIFNPNDRNCPPTNWNNAMLYYPGDGYCQLLGVTGYNNGTYYVQWGEAWREFDQIYDAIQRDYGTVFGQYPWIITEFSSSSVGGDKAAWIDNMFACIDNYPNIKAAVWFSSADYDSEGNVARPYWLDENAETLEAFRRGLTKYTSGTLVPE